MHKYSVQNLGCYGDGSFGHNHVRERLAALVAEAFPDGSQQALCDSLRDEMSDDASEEYEALQLLNDNATDGTIFEFDSGDLVLVRASDDE